MHHVWNHLAHISYRIFFSYRIFLSQWLYTVDCAPLMRRYSFNIFCFKCNLLQMKPTFLRTIQTLLRKLGVSSSGCLPVEHSQSLNPSQMSVQQFPSCFSQYRHPGEPYNTPLLLHRGWDRAASSAVLLPALWPGSWLRGAPHQPPTSLRADSHLRTC